MDLVQQTLLWAFGIALVVGATANKTNFCTMGAISDYISIGDSGRLRAWVFAIAVAIAGVALLELLTSTDMSLVDRGQTAKPPYGTPQFVWARYILGGLLFGIGMVLGSGCGNKTLVRIGGGNIKSVLVFLAMGVGAYLMIYTDFGYYLFLQWMPVVNLANFGINSQGLDAILSPALFGGDIALSWWGFAVSFVLAAVLAVWCFRSADFFKNSGHIVGGAVIGMAVVLAWYVTAGPLGQELLEEIAFLDKIPYDVGAQSLTFVKPSAHFYYWIREGFATNFLSFALIAAGGVVFGSFLYSILSKNFRMEWFANTKDFLSHLVGGLLMGSGGVLSLGCTFGQAISGASTLALGSFITFAFIIIGAATTMKVQYYYLLYEDQVTFPKALTTALADLKLLPNKWRQFEAL